MATPGERELKIRSNKSCLKTKPHKVDEVYPKTNSLYKTAWSPTLFTPILQYLYTDISAISVTFRNSAHP